MKVLQVIDKLDVGGAEKVFIMMSSLLYNAGVDVSVLLFDNSGDITNELDERLTVHNINRTNKYSLAALHRLHTICSTYDVVHVHMRHCFVYGRFAAFLFNGKYKIILHDHFGDIDKNASVPLKLKIFKPQAYIGVSTSLQKWAQEKLKLDKRRTYLLRNAILKSTVPNNKITSSPDVMMISNFRRTKNIEFAISIFQQLNWPLTIYGKINDIAYFNHIKDLIRDSENIKIVTSINDFSSIAYNHTMAIHTAVSESGPLVLLEYMAAGIAFLAYKTGEVATTTCTELPEMFMGNFDKDSWVQQIQVLTQNNWQDKLTTTFSKYFSTDKYVADCLEIYRNIHSS